MKEILLTFILIVNQPNGLTVPEAKKAQQIAVDKLNTLSPKVKFKALPLVRMRDPFPNVDNGYIRIGLWNNRYRRKHIAGNYVQVMDVNRDPRLGGLAYQCQPFTKRKQVSLTLQQSDGTSVYHGVAASHEIGHQIGFDHVAFYDGDQISIMDWDLYLYRFITKVRRFVFVDHMDILDQTGCKVNRVR